MCASGKILDGDMSLKCLSYLYLMLRIFITIRIIMHGSEKYLLHCHTMRAHIQ